MIELLVVDSNPAESYLVWYALEALDKPVKFHHAKDGAEALKILRRKKVDLVVLDLNLPGISGYEVLKQIDPLRIPVVIFSLSLGATDAQRALELGAREFVHKPSVLEEYRDCVVNMIEKWVPSVRKAVAST